MTAGALLACACATTPLMPALSAGLPATPTPSPTPVPVAELVVTGSVREWCGSIGGCAYFISIRGPAGSWSAELQPGDADGELAGGPGLPDAIPAGTYRVALSSVMVSDEVSNGVRELGPVDGSCSASLVVSGAGPIVVDGRFDKGSCEVGVTR